MNLNIKAAIMSIFILIFPKTVISASNNIIFIDASGSMKGFLGGTYSRIIANFDQPLLMSGIPFGNYTIKKVGPNILDVKDNVALSCFSNTPSLYNQSETNLAAVAEYIGKEKPPLALLITDSELDLAKKLSMEESCIRGYDLACMRVRFGALLVNKLYSMTVIGFKSKYTGKLYPPGRKPIILHSPIYKPVYIYIFSLPKSYETAEKLAEEILLLLKNERKYDKNLEYRIVKISPLIFPKVELRNNFTCPDLYVNEEKLIYGANPNFQISDTLLQCTFERAEKMKAFERLNFSIPLEIKIDSSLPISFSYEIHSEWAVEEDENWRNAKAYEIFGGTDPLKLSIKDDVLSFSFTSDLTKVKKNFKLKVVIISKVEASDIKIWRDWSTEDPSSMDYKNGKTLYISNFLEFLHRYYLNSVRHKERKIFTIEFTFYND